MPPVMLHWQNMHWNTKSWRYVFSSNSQLDYLCDEGHFYADVFVLTQQIWVPVTGPAVCSCLHAVWQRGLLRAGCVSCCFHMQQQKPAQCSAAMPLVRVHGASVAPGAQTTSPSSQPHCQNKGSNQLFDATTCI